MSALTWVWIIVAVIGLILRWWFARRFAGYSVLEDVTIIIFWPAFGFAFIVFFLAALAEDYSVKRAFKRLFNFDKP